MTLPQWAEWKSSEPPLTIGIEEEIMLLDPISWSLAQAIDEVLPRLAPEFAGQVHP